MSVGESGGATVVEALSEGDSETDNDTQLLGASDGVAVGVVHADADRDAELQAEGDLLTGADAESDCTAVCVADTDGERVEVRDDDCDCVLDEQAEVDGVPRGEAEIDVEREAVEDRDALGESVTALGVGDAVASPDEEGDADGDRDASRDAEELREMSVDEL